MFARKETANRRRDSMKKERAVNRRMADLAQSEIRAMTQACVSAKGLNMAEELARAC
jgi:hypothetical protein